MSLSLNGSSSFSTKRKEKFKSSSLKKNLHDLDPDPFFSSADQNKALSRIYLGYNPNFSFKHKSHE